ncbi:MAG: PKD domain-containing protein [Chitinivibrionales bacterium]|nr:PKD domain-containing protein [Chitinivibrionales bacterium]
MDVLRIAGTICVTLLVCSCMLCNKSNMIPIICGTVSSVDGSATCLRQQGVLPLQRGIQLQADDVIITQKSSSVGINFTTGHRIIACENTKFTISAITDTSGRENFWTVHQVSGTLFVGYPRSEKPPTKESLKVRCDSLVIYCQDASFTVQYSPRRGALIKMFSRSATINPVDDAGIDVEQCRKILVEEGGRISKQLPLAETDVTQLHTWVPAELDSLFGISGLLCQQLAQAQSQNLPPVWDKSPKKICRNGVVFNDTLTSTDPEGAAVLYSLIEAPVGMSINPRNGIISFLPHRAGINKIIISATDDRSSSSLLEYWLIVIGLVKANLNSSAVIAFGKSARFDASQSRNSRGLPEGLTYRFDVEGDGVWDYPKNGSYSWASTCTHTYAEPGEYTVIVEAKQKDTIIGAAMKRITVVRPPQIGCSFEPLYPTVQNVMTFTLLDSTQTPPGVASGIMVRWDFDGDGEWDYPEYGGYSDSMVLHYQWETSGIKRFFMEIQDGYGLRYTKPLTVKVLPRLVINSLSGPESVLMNDSFTVTCEVRDQRSPIKEYLWDFHASDAQPFTTTTNSVRFSYAEIGTFTLLCVVKNEMGLIDSATKKVVIKNSEAVVTAGGPYYTNVKTPCVIEGVFYPHKTGKRSPTVIYEWDFNNDEQYDTRSSNSASATKIFMNKGVFPIRLLVTLEDSTTYEATTTVTVMNRPPQANAGEDVTLQAGKSLLLKGSGFDLDDDIVSYEWDFNNDGTFDWQSKDTGYVMHRFDTYSTAVFKVTDSDKSVSVDSVRIVVCPDDMKRVPHGTFCIDTYEWPNQKGQKPQVSMTYEQAAAECGRMGKRLCTFGEMRVACSGSNRSGMYPYGPDFDPGKCNCQDNHTGKNTLLASGSLIGCVSPSGAADMSGNAAEWTASAPGSPTAYAFGGWFQEEEKSATCTSLIPLAKNKRYPNVGFRCCK